MKFNKQYYNLEKIKSCIKNEKLFFIYDTSDLNQKDWLDIEQNFKKSNLKFYKFNNVSIHIFLKTTIFKCLHAVINGPLKLVYLKNKEKPFKTLNDYQTQSYKQNFQFYLLKINNKIYSSLQLKNLKKFNYKTNLFNLQKNLNKNLYTNVVKLVKGSE